MIVASFPILSPCQWSSLWCPMSIRSYLNSIVTSLSVCGPPPNHLFIIYGGILEFLSHLLLLDDRFFIFRPSFPIDSSRILLLPIVCSPRVSAAFVGCSRYIPLLGLIWPVWAWEDADDGTIRNRFPELAPGVMFTPDSSRIAPSSGGKSGSFWATV